MEIFIKFTAQELTKAVQSGALDNLAAAIKDQLEEVVEEKAAAKPRAAKKPDPVVAKGPDPTPSPMQSVDTPEIPPDQRADLVEITIEMIRAKFAGLLESNNKEKIQTLLAGVGAKKLSEVKPEKYGELWAALA